MSPLTKEKETSLYRKILAAIILFIAIIYLVSVPQQSDFYGIIISGGIAFGAYFFLCYNSKLKFSQILALGLILRISTLFVFPNLSDDIYRFVWDGQLIANGLNPYGYLPSDIVLELDSPYWLHLFSNMNSPDYYTIYPPITQLIFYISTWAGENIWWSSCIIKIGFLIAEVSTFCGLIKLLDTLKKDVSLASIYFLNPLIIVEGMGNLHFEIIMISFLIWGIYFTIVEKRIVLGALFFSLSIASKLLPLMFLPVFLFKMNGKDRIRFFASGLVFLIVAFLPIILGLDFSNFGSSIDLYFQKFEFNAGIYYLLRYFGQILSGYNLIHYLGPLLGIIAVSLIVRKAYMSQNYSLQGFLDFAFYSFCAYLLLATTVHPWYMAIPVVLSVFVRFRFAVVWSFLIMLSYINYSYDPYFENLLVVGIEYVLITTMIGYEVYNMKGNNPKRLSKIT